MAFRHGETDWNKRELIQGDVNIPLNKNGIEQAEKVRGVMIKEKIDFVFSSDLLRAVQTAKIIFPRHKIHKTTYLREIDFGLYNGKNRWKVRREDLFFNNVLNNVNHPLHLYTPFPNGEAAIEAVIRMIRFLIKIEKKYPLKNIALFTHCDLLETLLEINNIKISKIDFASKIEFDFDSKSMQFSNFIF